MYFLNMRLKFLMLSNPQRKDTSVIERSSPDFRISTAFSTLTLFIYFEKVIHTELWKSREKYAGVIPMKLAADVKSKY